MSTYHCVCCLKDANEQILHITVQHAFAWLFRTLSVSVRLEPSGLFNDLCPEENRIPDILLRNSYGGGRQVMIDIAVTGINGSDFFKLTIIFLNLPRHIRLKLRFLIS